MRRNLGAHHCPDVVKRDEQVAACIICRMILGIESFQEEAMSSSREVLTIKLELPETSFFIEL